MVFNILKETQKISSKKAEALILDIARHSTNGSRLHGKSDDDVKQFFASQGYDWKTLRESIRTPGVPVPFVENLLGSSAFVFGGGKHDTLTIMHHGKPVASFHGSGQIAMFDYHAKYDQAITCRKRVIKDAQYTELLSCASHGIAAVESYINTQAFYWNNNHPNDTLDLQEDRLDIKLNDWLKKMTGKRLNHLSCWNHFKDYQAVNNEGLKHTMHPAHAVNFSEMATTLNKFRYGIAKILFELHIAFKQMVPVSIIRGMYFADIEVINT